MTVYVSRYAATGELKGGRVAVPASARRGSTDPPLLTHAWRIVLELQTREGDRR